MSYFDFNSADDAANNQPLIPKGTLARVRLFIRPGGYDEPRKGWTSGYAKRSDDTGSVYLDCEFTVTEGPFARRKIWTLIGLHSEKSDQWFKMGRAMIKGILNSAFGLQALDESPVAQAKRRIASFADLDGLEFLAKIDVELDAQRGEKNVLKAAIGPEHKDYAAIMQGVPNSVRVGTGSASGNGGGTGGASAPPPAAMPSPAAQRAGVPTRPAWAQ
jgi:hypothetical protein